MRLEPPQWWYGSGPSNRLRAALLQSAGFLYGAAVQARFALKKPYRSRLPVVCVGNFTMGGAGKTPLALALAKILQEMGHKPAFLTRGYGGRLVGPHLVDPETDTALDVGDEALLLAGGAPTMLSRDRPAGARAIESLAASIILMDDGFQNPSLVKDLVFIAIDAAAGIGNGRVFPAGPLRAPLSFQITRSNAAVLIGHHQKAAAFLNGVIPVIEARLTPAGDTTWLRSQPILAFCGIGRPEKFFETLRENSANLITARAFPDHHIFTQAEAAELIETASQSGALPVTTEKDWVRIPVIPGPLADLKAVTRPLPVTLIFSRNGKKAIDLLLASLQYDRLST